MIQEFLRVPSGDQNEPAVRSSLCNRSRPPRGGSASRKCVRGPTPPIRIERTSLLNKRGQQGNVYQAHQQGKWNPRSSAYGRFWVDVPSGERKRRTVSLGLCATQWVARLRLREYIERAGVSSKHTFHQSPVPGTTFRQQAEWWMESLSTRRRRPLKPATVYGWQHCLERWILPNLGNKLVSEVGNGALRQFVEILTAAAVSASEKGSHSGRCWSGPVIHQNPLARTQYEL